MLNMIGLVFSLPTKKKFNCNEDCGKMTKTYAENILVRLLEVMLAINEDKVGRLGLQPISLRSLKLEIVSQVSQRHSFR